MADRYKVTDEDIALFRRMVGRVKPLRHNSAPPVKQKAPPVPKQRQQDEQQVLDDMLSEAVAIDEVECGDELLFSRPGIQHSVVRKLRRGQFSVDDELDLHGMNTHNARENLVGFLRRCQFKGARCVRIIHGKGRGSSHGRPVLKNKVNVWLQQRDDVLAFCSARPVDGGTGAIYVLLKRKY